MSAELRQRMADVIHRTKAPLHDHGEAVAQAIIDEFDLSVETVPEGWSWSSGGDAVRLPGESRIVGRGEVQ